MNAQPTAQIYLNAPQLLYLWRLAWLCQLYQIAAKSTSAQPKPLQGKKSQEPGSTKKKSLATACYIKGNTPSVRRSTSGVPIFANGATTAAFSYLFANAAAARQARPTMQRGQGGTAFVGGFFDKTINGPVLQAYQSHVRAGGNGAYFQWYESDALGQWIDANGGNVSVIGHSYGGDMAAEVVAAGHAVNALRTVDPVGWTRPNFADVAANSGSWVNYNAVGGGATWPNFVAGMGGAWNNAPSGYASHSNVPYDHAGVCFQYCSP